jgi:GNAT superfamily N-acetyltransferase
VAEPSDDPPDSYTVQEVTSTDAEDVSKLIYRTYGYTYADDDMYHPKRIELGIARGEKFGVIARSQGGEATGYFAMLRKSDSAIGEVAEVAVSPRHRRKGLMTRMLAALVERARAEGMRALFGEAVAVHDISQRVNHKLGFHSTALILAAFPITRYRQLVEAYPQDMPAVLDFILFEPETRRSVYLPVKYRQILRDIYGRLGIEVDERRSARLRTARKTQLDVDIAYHNHNAVIVVRRFGRNFRDSVIQTAASLRERNINAIYVDLPLDNPYIDRGVKTLESLGYVFAGLMPLFHEDRDYLRMQAVRSDIDFDLIATWSKTAGQIKRRIQNEMQWTTKRPTTNFVSG